MEIKRIEIRENSFGEASISCEVNGYPVHLSWNPEAPNEPPKIHVSSTCGTGANYLASWSEYARVYGELGAMTFAQASEFLKQNNMPIVEK